MPTVVGIDSSTQSTKIEARDLDTGEILARGSAPHPPTSPPVSEQAPEAWWTAVVDSFTQLGDRRSDVVAISVAAQQHGMVLADSAGRPLRKAKLWNDLSSASQAQRLVDELGADLWAEQVGSVPVAAFTITKLAWMAAHEPETLRAATHILLPHDWLNLQLTGVACTDRGDASGTGWYTIDALELSTSLLETATGLSLEWAALMAQVLKPTQAAGTLTPEAAAALGLSPDVIVGPGTGDNMAAALGLGLQRGDVAVSLGTSGTVYSVSERPVRDSSGRVAGFADASGGYLPLVCTLNATRVTDTVAAWFDTDPSGLSDLALSADFADPGPVMVPYFAGERTPNRPAATGLLSGLTNETTRAQIALSAHDGVLCGLLHGLDALREAGVPANGTLHLIGGGSRSRAYRQRCADLHGQPILVPDSDETVATGAAVQAAAVLSNRPLVDIAQAWDLGAGSVVEPLHNAEEVRDRYRAASR